MGDTARAQALRLRAALRTEQSTPLVAALRTWAHRQRTLPESSLGKVIAYMLGLWPRLTRFLADPRIPLDNNATGRGLRGLVVGRKKHSGSRYKRGTEVAGPFYSLIESAKLCGVEPKAYLLQAARTVRRPSKSFNPCTFTRLEEAAFLFPMRSPEATARRYATALDIHCARRYPGLQALSGAIYLP